MAKLTISAAARACSVDRRTIQRAVKCGRLSLDADHQVDTAELLRAGFQLDAAVSQVDMPQTGAASPQDAASTGRTSQPEDATPEELALLRKELDLLRQENTRLAQQVEALITIQQGTQQHLTQAQEMLRAMQERYDRLLAAPAAVPQGWPAAVPQDAAPSAAPLLHRLWHRVRVWSGRLG
jgi:hypothetical protein